VSPRLRILLFGLAALAFVTALRVFDPQPVQQIRLSVFDTYQRLAPRPYEPSPVRVIGIDNESLARFGQWPWPRPLVAEMIERLADLGAAAVGFSVIFAEPDRTSPLRMREVWSRTTEAGPLAAALSKLPDHDEVLAGTLARTPVVLGFALGPDGAPTPPPEKFGFAYRGDDPLLSLPEHRVATANLPAFQAAASGIGVLTVRVDPDGLIRRVALLSRIGGRAYPSLGVEALRVAQGVSTLVARGTDSAGDFLATTPGLTDVKVGGFVVPTSRDGEMWLHFTEAAQERIVPAWRLFENAPADLAPVIEGHVVLIGTTAPGLRSARATPLRPVEASVVIHAQAIEQMILGRFLERPDWADGVEVVILLALGTLLSLLHAFHRGALVAVLAGVVAASGVWGASWYAYAGAGLLLDPLYPTLAAVSIYLLAGTLRYLLGERERRRVRTAFGRYLAPSLVERLAEHPEELKLGGETRELTLMFCDIRGFTTISERLTAEELTRFINRFLTPMTDVILETGGTVDKYMGDAIMAFWNAPLPKADHHLAGCRAALTMRRRLAELVPVWRAEAEAAGQPSFPVRIGIGLNSGPCCVGNVGSEQRFDYSVLGDAVNVASRLEQQTKGYGVDIIVGEETQRHTAHFAHLELGLVRLRGKAQGMRIFFLAGDERRAEEAAFLALRSRHDEALAAFRARDWEEARTGFEACRVLAGGELDALYDAFAAEVAALRDHPPGGRIGTGSWSLADIVSPARFRYGCFGSTIARPKVRQHRIFAFAIPCRADS